MARLGLQQTTSLLQTIKPQQILVSTLLQLPMLMLEQKIKTELEINPVLEESDEWEDLNGEEEEEPIEENREETEEIQQEFEELKDAEQQETETENEDVEEDFDLEHMIPDEEEQFERRQPRDPNEEERDMPERYYESMFEHILEQMHMLNFTPVEHRIGEYIVYNLREDGYLDDEVSVESISQIFEVEEQVVE